MTRLLAAHSLTHNSHMPRTAQLRKAMSIQLYRPGNDQNICGIDCEIINCKISSMQSMLDSGWFAHPDDFASAGEDEQSGGEDEVSAEEIRVLAKDAGIEGYEKKRVKTLIKELEDLTNVD